MIPEEEANAAALRRIREANETGATYLDLSGLQFLRQLPRELERLEFLQTLNLSGCEQLSGDLSPLAGLTSLQTLDLSWCSALRQFDPLKDLLPSLQGLYLFCCKFDDLSTGRQQQNVSCLADSLVQSIQGRSGQRQKPFQRSSSLAQFVGCEDPRIVRARRIESIIRQRTSP